MSDETDSEQLALTKRLVELSAYRSFQSAERTLSVWIRTALAFMIFGIAIDRFDLLLRQQPDSAVHEQSYVNGLSSDCGVALVVLGVLMLITTGLRFVAYATTCKRQQELPPYHGPYLAPFFTLMAAIFGLLLLVILPVTGA